MNVVAWFGAAFAVVMVVLAVKWVWEAQNTPAKKVQRQFVRATKAAMRDQRWARPLPCNRCGRLTMVKKGWLLWECVNAECDG